ncbi:hypothetical protein C8R42DRAFT_725703 [Lentinula raphanica]|nr:hypothetical protein C8R42DRAFT_725703 [Lentinula raphanica]
MNEQQWSQYRPSPLQNSLQQSPPLNLSFDVNWPTESPATNESDRVFSNFSNAAYSYGSSSVDRPLEWMSINQNIDMVDANMEVVSEEVNKQQVIAIQLCLALVTNALWTPKLVFGVELEAESQSITKQNGIFEISVESILSLTSLAYLPSEITLALQNVEISFATAEGVPPLFYPVHLLPSFRLLASMTEISISSPSNFRLQSVSNTGFSYFLPVRESEQPKFVLILLGGSTNSALTAPLQSESQPSIPRDIVNTDRPSDVTYASIPAHRHTSLPDTSSGTEIPFESQIDSAIPVPAMSDLPAAYTQVASPIPQLSDTEANEVGPEPTESQNTSSEIQYPVRAININHACGLIGIPVPQGPPPSFEACQKRPISEMIQDWYRAWMLTAGLGYDETKGSLDVQTYTWKNGKVETFEQILRGVNWKPGSFVRKTALYSWAINATSTKVWDASLTVPVGQERLINAAKQTWNQLVLFFQETSFLFSGDPRSSPRNSREFGLTYLHEADVRKYKQYIKGYLIDRPEVSG